MQTYGRFRNYYKYWLKLIHTNIQIFNYTNFVQIMQTPQRQTTNTQQPSSASFIVKVKLLTNEVYEFPIYPDTTLVSDFKKMILEKINVPLQRQRIVFGGKQLQDDQLVSSYVKQSGMTVHLIAKSTTQSNNQQPTSSTQNLNQPGQSQSNPNTNNSQGQSSHQSQSNRNHNNQNQQGSGFQNFSSSNFGSSSNPFGNIFSMIGGSLGNPQTTSVSFGNINDLNGLLGSLVGNLGRGNNQGNNQRGQNIFQTPPNNNSNRGSGSMGTNPFNVQNQQNQGTQGPVQNQSSQNQVNQFNVSNQPLLNLNQVISTMNLPNQPVLDNSHLNLREQTSQYLRRLQHMYMRMMPQLNRGIFLLNEGQTNHLPQVLRLFQSLDGANRHAEEALRRLINQELDGGNSNSQQNSTNQNFQQNYSNSFGSNRNSNGNNSQGNDSHSEHRMEEQIGQQDGHTGNIQATIIIQEQFLDPDIDEQPTVFTNNQAQNNISNSNQIQNNLPNNNRNQNNPSSNNLNQNNLLNNNPTQNSSSNLGQISQNQGNTQTQNQGNRQSQPMPINLGNIMSMLGGGQNQNISGQTGSQNSQLRQGQGQFDLGGLMNMASMFLGSPNRGQSNQSNSGQSNQQNNVFSTSSPQMPTNSQMHDPTRQTTNQQQLNNLQTPQPNSNQNDTTNNSSSQGQNISSPNSNPNPLSGVNLMGIFSSLQQSGGIGELMGMSIGQMLQEGSQPGIYSTLFRPFVGSDILNCFTSKNFDFLDNKQPQIRQHLVKASQLAGSEEKLIETLAEDLTDIIVPYNAVLAREDCLTQVRNITTNSFIEAVASTHDSKGEKYSQKVLNSLKNAFCLSINRIVSQVNPVALRENQTAEDLVFEHIKNSCIERMNEFIPGLAGMFYGFIERDLMRVYKEYKQEQQRKAQQSASQAIKEEQLLKQIEETSKKDVEYLKNFQHSAYYRPKSQ